MRAECLPAAEHATVLPVAQTQLGLAEGNRPSTHRVTPGPTSGVSIAAKNGSFSSGSLLQ